MDTVTQVVDSTLLSGIISLPRRFRNKRVEVTISLDEDKSALPTMTLSDIDAMMKGSITESLTGVILKSEKTLEDYRAERLTKYEHTN